MHLGGKPKFKIYLILIKNCRWHCKVVTTVNNTIITRYRILKIIYQILTMCTFKLVLVKSALINSGYLHVLRIIVHDKKNSQTPLGFIIKYYRLRLNVSRAVEW